MKGWMYFSVKVDGVDVDEEEVASALDKMSEREVKDEFLGSSGFLFVGIDDWPEFQADIDSRVNDEFGSDFVEEFYDAFSGDMPDGAQVAVSAANDMRDLGVVLVYEFGGDEWSLVDKYVGMEGYQGADIVDGIHEQHGWSPPVEEHPDRL